MNVDDIISEYLDEYTAIPKDGDYDAHTYKAMVAMFDVLKKFIDEREFAIIELEEELEKAQYCIDDLEEDLLEMRNEF